MLTQNDLSQLTDATVYTTDGDKIGSAGQVYLDNRSGDPEWVSVKTGLFGTKESFVPLQRATLSGDRLTVPFGKDQVKDAPQIDVDGELSPAEEDKLYTYYGLSSSEGNLATDGDSTYNDSNYAAGTHRDDSVERGDDEASITRSEERLVAGTRREEAGTARLRKYVVTEQAHVTVPVQREEVTLDREPITDGNVGDAFDGPAISESEHEVTLHAERAVVDTEAVPVERVRLGKKVVTDEETVSGEVRKEQVEFDGTDGRRN